MDAVTAASAADGECEMTTCEQCYGFLLRGFMLAAYETFFPARHYFSNAALTAAKEEI